jgi:hypothetical protein
VIAMKITVFPHMMLHILVLSMFQRNLLSPFLEQDTLEVTGSLET